MESSDLAKMLAQMASVAILNARCVTARQQYERFESCKLDDGKYNRRKIEHIEGMSHHKS